MKKKENKSSEEKVISAAIKEFAAHGFEGARVDAIAEKAKVNKAMIYYHFKSKEKLYERILKDITDSIFVQIKEASLGEGNPVEVFYAIINKYMSMVNSFNIEVFQILQREVVNGGKHFRKIAIPNLVVPIYSIIEPLIKSAIDKGLMRDVNPYYTFMQIIGGVIFFNIIRVPMEGSVLEKTLLKDGYADEYRENLFKIIKNGLELKDGKS